MCELSSRPLNLGERRYIEDEKYEKCLKDIIWFYVECESKLTELRVLLQHANQSKLDLN